MKPQGTEAFFAYARERYHIKLRRDAGQPKPWTEDPVLQQWRFCHVFREDDKTTAWFRDNIREPLHWEYDAVLWATVAFRWFTRIETGEKIKNVLLNYGWDEQLVRAAVRGLRPLVTGAYMILPRPGVRDVNKLDSICWCMERFEETSAKFIAAKPKTLQHAHELLMGAPGLGPFMAYEVVTDLRHTCVLEDAPDVNTWANLGPGARRGLEHVHGWCKPATAVPLMQSLLADSRHTQLWPWPERPWELREVEHTLCEFDKYVRAMQGRKLKRRYE